MNRAFSGNEKNKHYKWYLMYLELSECIKRLEKLKSNHDSPSNVQQKESSEELAQLSYTHDDFEYIYKNGEELELSLYHPRTSLLINMIFVPEFKRSKLLHPEINIIQLNLHTLSGQHFSTSFHNIIKHNISEYGYNSYNKHLWNYSQMFKLDYIIKG